MVATWQGNVDDSYMVAWQRLGLSLRLATGNLAKAMMHWGRRRSMKETLQTKQPIHGGLVALKTMLGLDFKDYGPI